MQSDQDKLIKSLMDRKWRLKMNILESQKARRSTESFTSELEQVETQLSTFDTFDLIPENFEDL